MFDFLRKSVAKVSDALQQSKSVEGSIYPKEVVEIHREFNTAGEKLLAEAVGIIQKSQSPEIEKAKRLNFLGFSQAKQVEESSQILKQAVISKEVAELVRKYQVMYPNNKFITEEQVKAICFKYNLICGEVKRFKGFVPEKNLLEIENFKKRYKTPQQVRVTNWQKGDVDIISLDDYKREESSGYISYRHIATDRHCLQQNKTDYDGIHFYGSYINSNGKYENGTFRFEIIGLQICAPVKDMDMEGMTIQEGYKMRKIHVPDPVVLQPLPGGYIVISAWGDEASDENVVNQNHN